MQEKGITFEMVCGCGQTFNPRHLFDHCSQLVRPVKQGGSQTTRLA